MQPRQIQIRVSQQPPDSQVHVGVRGEVSELRAGSATAGTASGGWQPPGSFAPRCPRPGGWALAAAAPRPASLPSPRRSSPLTATEPEEEATKTRITIFTSWAAPPPRRRDQTGRGSEAAGTPLPRTGRGQGRPAPPRHRPLRAAATLSTLFPRGGSPSRASRVRLLADRRQAITARGGKGGGGAQGPTGAVVLPGRGPARCSSCFTSKTEPSRQPACSELPCPRPPGLPGATIRVWEAEKGLVPPSRCAARRSRWPQRMMNNTLKFIPSAIRAASPWQLGPPGCSWSSYPVRSATSALPGLGPAPLAAIYSGEGVENGVILVRPHRHIPVRAGKRNNAREVGHWVRGLFNTIHLKGVKQHCLFSLPGIDVQFSILSTVEQMLLISRISR